MQTIREKIYSLLDDTYDEMNVDSDSYKEALRLTKDLCSFEFPDLHTCLFNNSDTDLIFADLGGGYKVYYYNPDSNAGGQIVECQLEKVDLKEIMDGEDLMEVLAKYTQYLSDINTVHFFDTIFKLLDMKEQGLYIGTDINKLYYDYLSAIKEGSKYLGEKRLAADEVKKGTWKIWFERFDEEGKKYGAGVMPQEYTHKSSAVRAAKRYMEKPGFKCVVSQENPFFKRSEDEKMSLDKRMLAASESRNDEVHLSGKSVGKAGQYGQVR